MSLDVVLGDEVRDVGRVVDGLFAAAVNGAVDEVLHAVFQGFVDQAFALGFFCVSVYTLIR